MLLAHRNRAGSWVSSGVLSPLTENVRESDRGGKWVRGSWLNLELDDVVASAIRNRKETRPAPVDGGALPQESSGATRDFRH